MFDGVFVKNRSVVDVVSFKMKMKRTVNANACLNSKRGRLALLTKTEYIISYFPRILSHFLGKMKSFFFSFLAVGCEYSQESKRARHDALSFGDLFLDLFSTGGRISSHHMQFEKIQQVFLVCQHVIGQLFDLAVRKNQ